VANADKPKQLFWAILGIAVNLSILGLFKYGGLLNNFFTNIFQASNRAEEGIIHLLLQLLRFKRTIKKGTTTIKTYLAAVFIRFNPCSRCILFCIDRLAFVQIT
jgi:hypothetical protein